MYFFNCVLKCSTWEHPLYSYYSFLIGELRCELPFVAVSGAVAGRGEAGEILDGEGGRYPLSNPFIGGGEGAHDYKGADAPRGSGEGGKIVRVGVGDVLIALYGDAEEKRQRCGRGVGKEDAERELLCRRVVYHPLLFYAWLFGDGEGYWVLADCDRKLLPSRCVCASADDSTDAACIHSHWMRVISA
jgi:hypothetical protein